MNQHHSWRLLVLLIFIFLLGGGVLSRLFFLQILQHEYYSALAKGQHQLYQTLFPRRGEIFMQDISASHREGRDKYYPLAVNKEFKRAYIIPKDIAKEGREGLADKLAEILELDRELILERMAKENDPYEPLKSRIGEEAAQKIEELNIKGVGLFPEIWRYYPNDSLACHLIGFVGIADNQRVGQYGLEEYYEDELNGKAGFLAGEKDTAGYWIPSLDQKFKPAVDGSSLVLTLDQNIQFKVEKELDYLIGRWQAETGTIIVMEPKTGAIRAMASWPDFDPNKYGEVEDINVFLNPAIQKVYEPGSVFKPFTMAAGLDYKKITPATTYRDMGEIRFGGSVIKNVDSKVYGEQSMTEVLEKSLNTGAVFVQQALGHNLFKKFIQKLNFGQPTGIDTVGEISGDISNLFTGRDINLATISFGQGISVTPLSLITAMGAVANQGNLMKPYLVEKIIKADGTEIKAKPQVIEQIISSETAYQLSTMMASVVDNGYGRPARVAGYSIAGKTGTAQMVDFEKGGYSEDTVHTFIGFAPAFDPQFVILIKLDKPIGISFAADSVSPSFKKLAQYIFNYLEIPPQ